MKQSTEHAIDHVLEFIITVIIISAINLFASQLVVWGLAQFHVSSGILGPWLLISGLAMVISLAMRDAIHK